MNILPDTQMILDRLLLLEKTVRETKLDVKAIANRFLDLSRDLSDHEKEDSYSDPATRIARDLVRLMRTGKTGADIKRAITTANHDVQARWAGDPSAPSDPAAVQAMVEDNRKKRERIKQLEREVAERQKALDEARARMATLRDRHATEIAQKNKVIEDCRKRLDTDTFRSLMHANGFEAQPDPTLVEELKKRDEEVAAVRTENARLRSRIDTLHNDLTKTRRDCSAAIEKSREGEQARRETLLRKIEQLEADEKKSSASSLCRKGRLTDRETTIQLKTARIMELETTQANLRKMHEEQTRHSHALESEVARKEDALALLNKTLDHALAVNTKRAEALRTALQFVERYRINYGAEMVISTCREALK